MSLHDLFLILHLLLFCYWLGADLGVFYSSGMVINPKLSNEARVTAGKIMVNLDLVPRVCMSLMLTVGGILTEFKGVPHPWWQMVAIVLLGPVWLSMVLTIHLQEGSSLGQTVTRIDYWFRWLVILSCIVSVWWSFATGRLTDAPWIGFKILVFGVLVFCGLMIRRYIGPYAVGIHKLATGAITDEDNVAMARSLSRCRPFVLAIWVGILVETWLGVAEPGGRAATELLGALAAAITF